MKRVDFDRGKQEKLAPSLEEELSHSRVLSQANRPVESIHGFRCLPQPLQQVSASRPVGLITGDGFRVEPIQYRQPRFRSNGFRNCRGISSSCDERRRYADQLFVEQDTWDLLY